LIWHPVLLRFLLRRAQRDISLIRADMHPSAAIAIFAFAAQPEFWEGSLQKSDHPVDIAYSEIRVFKPNSH
jgi:hypothetical protein